jgi:hypothetical protein
VRVVKKLGLVASLSALAIMPLGTSVARAEGPADVLTTTFNGVASLSPAIPPPPAGFGQTGTYTFSGNVPGTLPNGLPGACTLVDGTDLTETNTCSGTISSSGTYVNSECGTGTADGTAQIIGTPAAESAFVIMYHIDFVDGAGELSIRGGSHRDGTGATGTGKVWLTQLPGENCATTGATGFNVFGSATVSFAE